MGEKPKVADPTISVVMPTRNSQKTIGESLRTLDEQIYPKEKIELIVVDAYSRDGTLQVARTFGAKVLTNPFVTGEAGKSIGVKVAKGDLILFMDSDNLLISPNWLRAMLNPLMENPSVIASEALYYH